MSESAGKCRKRYVDNPKDISKLTCTIHGPGHSSDECKVLGDFVTNYAKDGRTKYWLQKPATKKKFIRKNENNSIVQHSVYDIILQDNKKISVKDETHENINSEVDEEKLYKLDKISLDEQ